MDLHKLVMRTCIFVIVSAMLLRLLGSVPREKYAEIFSEKKIATLLLTLGTGRRLSGTNIPLHGTAQISPTTPTQQAVSPAVFSKKDVGFLTFRNTSGYSVNGEELLKAPLQWELTGEQPTVLILHTHATESYTKTESYTESSKYRTLNCDYNMVSIGDKLTQLLESAGIRVIHDRTLHDHPSYNDAYTNARATIDKHLAEHPGIFLVIDLHRDAMEDSNGKQIATTASTPLGKSAQMMLVMGTDAGGFYHPGWKENLALAAKLQVLLERQNKGICRPINLRSQRFNQDASPGALLIEMGAAGNTRREALVAAEYLAQAIIALAHGSSYK